ncbi:MAG: DUF167 domain-containing protein [Candidatus Niyogibacteria bacterium]|nr:DUF167 domain-containing protein [Candidatus Niyogibacteria bacterium]
MRYTVLAKPNAKHPKIEAVDERTLKVWIDAPAREDAANDRLIDLLADHFGVAPTRVRIVHGATAKTKLVEII